MTEWRVPQNLPALVQTWKTRLDYFTRRPKQWNWFIDWLDNPKTRFRGDQENMWKILYAFGHPPGRRLIRPPPKLVNDVKQLAGLTNTPKDDNDPAGVTKYDELLRKYTKLQNAFKQLNTSKMEKSCRNLEEVVERQQAEIESLRKQLDILTNAPPPPMVSPQQARDAVETQKKEVLTVVTELQNIPDAPPPPPPPTRSPKRVTLPNRATTTPAKRDTPPGGLEGTLQNALQKRRGALQPEDNHSPEYDAWEDEDCKICGNVTRLTCGKCRSVRYCSSACQAEDWKHHSIWC